MAKMIAKKRQVFLYGLRKEIKKNWILYLMMLPVVLYFLIFEYWPMYGIQLAFKNFKIKELPV
ncbi:MAG: hypothetical protein IJZ34_05780 [Lachnospiraceae bacterium]|nr:hypothetical protein [Lachnospiraceae bacterium]